MYGVVSHGGGSGRRIVPSCPPGQRRLHGDTQHEVNEVIDEVANESRETLLDEDNVATEQQETKNTYGD